MAPSGASSRRRRGFFHLQGRVSTRGLPKFWPQADPVLAVDAAMKGGATSGYVGCRLPDGNRIKPAGIQGRAEGADRGECRTFGLPAWTSGMITCSTWQRPGIRCSRESVNARGLPEFWPQADSAQPAASEQITARTARAECALEPKSPFTGPPTTLLR